MGDTFVISGLTTKRAELLGLAESLEAKAKQARADLLHIDAALRLFDPTLNLDVIRGKSLTKGRSPWFGVGEMSRSCREILRDAADPLSADAVARKLMVRQGIDPDDRNQRSPIILRVLQTLHRMAKRGDVERIGRGNGVLWTVAGNSGAASL